MKRGGEKADAEAGGVGGIGPNLSNSVRSPSCSLVVLQHTMQCLSVSESGCVPSLSAHWSNVFATPAPMSLVALASSHIGGPLNSIG